jgi:catechol 2,3-dioxygenase-like lactoylglutathione lyase family enzyme
MAGELASEAVCQVALVVKNIEAAAKAWAEVLGVPVPEARLTDPASQAHTRYRGRPTEARAKLAFFRLGPVSIELIEPVGEPSTWHDGLRGPSAVHHIAFHVKDAAPVLERLAGLGLKAVQTGDYRGGRYTYVDAAARLGVTLELLEDRPAA